MNYKLLTESDFRVSNWTGGKTRQLAIFPEDGNYLERRFLWRLSSATCEMEESDFSKLPDFDRVLMVLEGNVVLAHEGIRMAKLGEYEQDSFDGGYKTKSFGKITDYNLMVAKGSKGFLEAVDAEESAKTIELADVEDFDDKTMGIYIAEGFATVTLGAETLMAKAGNQLVINAKAGEKVSVSVMGEGKCVVSRIYYTYKLEEYGPEDIPAEKVSFRDFLDCMYLANTDFHGASYIFKRKKNEWLDEKLQRALKPFNTFYLTYIAFIIGAMVAIFVTKDQSGAHILAAVAIWLVVDILLVSPLMYLIALPKPVGKHIKKIDQLTPYERKIYEQQMATNEKLEKLMKKYKRLEDRK